MAPAPAFWFARRPGVMALLLWPFSLIYWGVSRAHAWLRGLNPYYAAVPVVSIGNVTVGGSGKTPLVEALARYLSEQGHAVAVVARGHGGRETRWPVQVQPHLHTAVQVGDEPLMLARHLARRAVVWVGKNRRQAVRRAEEAGATVIILDDAFHRRDIGRNADVVVVDGPRGFGNGMLLPAGPLREPVSGIARASFAVVMDEPVERANRWYGITAYRLKLLPQPGQLAALQGQPVVAFAGIGNPDKFFAMLKQRGVQVAAAVGYDDHHRYRTRDVQELEALARQHNARLVTTAKDAVKLPRRFAEVVDIAPVGGDWKALLDDLLPRLEN